MVSILRRVWQNDLTKPSTGATISYATCFVCEAGYHA